MATIVKTPKKKQAKAREAASLRYIVLGRRPTWVKHLPQKSFLVCTSLSQIQDALHRANRNSLWIAKHADIIDRLIRAMTSSEAATSTFQTNIGNLLLLDVPRQKALACLYTYFSSVVGADADFKFLPQDQLAHVLSLSPGAARDSFIGGVVDSKTNVLALIRGDLSRLAVPLTLFQPSGTSVPDFDHFDLDDYGQTLRFGDYEAAADFVLYAVDPEFRSRARAKRIKDDKGFGPSLRRLRILRKLGREDFPDISGKTIARIERGEVKKPRGETLCTICETLRVAANEIETY